MRRLIESSLVSFDGITEPPERRAKFDAESVALSWSTVVLARAPSQLQPPVRQAGAMSGRSPT